MMSDYNGTPKDWNDGFYPAFRGNPFGETMRSQVNSGPDPRYGYVSKEFDTEVGTLHFGQRDYDPWAGFFHSVDPFADKYPSQSPYSYALDNPEIFIDINGDSVGSWLTVFNSFVQQVNQFVQTLRGDLTPQSSTPESVDQTTSAANNVTLAAQNTKMLGGLAKQGTVNGLEGIHTLASTYGGFAAIGGLSTMGTPMSPVLLGSADIAGWTAAGASTSEWLITGNTEIGNRALFEVTTLGTGAVVGKTFEMGTTFGTGENLQTLHDVFSGTWGGLNYGIGLGLGY